MNIYLQNRGPAGNLRVLGKCIQKLPRDEQVKLHLISSRRVHPAHLSALAAVHKRIRNIELMIPAEKLTRGIIYFANKNKGLQLLLRTDRRISHRAWARICKLSHLVPILDSTQDGSNEERYQSNRNVVYSDERQDGITVAEIYSIAAGMPAERCEFSSCLGKNLYIDLTGTVSYCPRHPKETGMGKLEDIEEFFADESFARTLREMIAKRNECRQTCPHFAQCQSGCAFHSHCGLFREICPKAAAELEEIVGLHTELTDLSLYKERALLYKLFNKVRYPADQIT